MRTISLSLSCLRLFIVYKAFLAVYAKLDVSTTEKALINALSNKFVYLSLSVTRSV